MCWWLVFAECTWGHPAWSSLRCTDNTLSQQLTSLPIWSSLQLHLWTSPSYACTALTSIWDRWQHAMSRAHIWLPIAFLQTWMVHFRKPFLGHHNSIGGSNPGVKQLCYRLFNRIIETKASMWNRWCFVDLALTFTPKCLGTSSGSNVTWKDEPPRSRLPTFDSLGTCPNLPKL